jgi:YVTN family beta-propeller protein
MKNHFNLVKSTLALSLISTFVFTSCKKDDVIPISSNITGAYTTGFFIANEGTFNGGNASVSFYNTNNNVVTNNIFQLANNRPLGDQLQSITVKDTIVYLVVQNSKKIEVVGKTSFKSITTIGGIKSPRYLTVVSSTKVYVSDWASDSIKIIDTKSFKVIGSIAVGIDPNQMLLVGNDLYVANSSYSYGSSNDKTVSIIDITTDRVTKTITVGDKPNSLVLQNGKVWVGCYGNTIYSPPSYALDTINSTKGGIYGIDISTKAVVKSYLMPNFNSPKFLCADNFSNNLYYYSGGKVYLQSLDSTNLTKKVVLSKSLYGMNLDATNAGVLWGFDAIDYVNNGKICKYDFDNSTQTFLEYQSNRVGKVPNGLAY